MATKQTEEINSAATKAVVAIRERWHTKNHPFFRAFADGTLELKSMGRYMAQHYKFVQVAVPVQGTLYTRAPPDVRKAVVENLAEEEGIKAISVSGHEPHDHNELIFLFCRAAGLSEKEVRNMQPTPAWWGRTLHYAQTIREEPIGVALAMMSTQEGQQVALNRQVTLPAFAKHYGFQANAPEIEFFTEHAEADLEHSERQLALCAKYLDTPELVERALEVAEIACRLRWASITDIYRSDVLGVEDPLPAHAA